MIGGVGGAQGTSSVLQSQPGVQVAKVQGEVSSVIKNALSVIPDDELMSQKLASQGGRKLNISVKKEDKSVDKTKEVQKQESAQQVTTGLDSDFAEEIASIIRILKKPNRSEEDEEKIKKLIDETSDNYEEAIEKLAVKTLEMLDPAAKGKYSDDITSLENKLQAVKDKKEGAAKDFLNEFQRALQEIQSAHSTNTDTSRNVEKEREFIDSPGKLLFKLIKEYPKVNNLEPLIALNVKILANEAGQAGHNIDRLYVITTELKNTQVLGTLNEDCSHAETQLSRSCGYKLIDGMGQAGNSQPLTVS